MRVLAIVGPTAVGKSDLAMAVAARLPDAEIVGADSMQVYSGMDIGTAKPTPAERAAVPHHMLDVWPPQHDVSVAEFQQRARAAIDGIGQRRGLPILVGGSGLYVSAILDDLQFPGTDPAVRARLEAELGKSSPAAMHERLARIDPEAAAAILPSNGRRIVRALEVVEITGQPFKAALPQGTSVYPAVRLGLEIDRESLDARIAERGDGMWSRGLVQEVRELAVRGLGPTASRALGYAQVLRHLEGECSEEQAKQDTIDATRRFARRQQRWFKRDDRIRWLPYDASDLPDAVLAALGPETST